MTYKIGQKVRIKENAKEECDKKDTSEYDRMYYSKNSERIKARKREYYKKTVDKRKEYRLKNAEKIKEYRLKNAEKNSEYYKSYYRKNRDYILERERTRRKLNVKDRMRKERDKMVTNIQYRLGMLMKDRLRKAIKNNYLSGKAVEELGCSIKFFKEYFESKFKEGMSWNNWGEWQIDHIYPISKVDLTDYSQLLKVSHYTNLQPLWPSENISKGNSVQE